MKTKLKLLILIPVLCLALPTSGLAICKAVQDQDETWSIDKSPDCRRNGKWHGQWEFQYANGNVKTGPFVDGKRHGQWEERFASGNVKVKYVKDDKETGQVEFREADGDVGIGYEDENGRQGEWKWRFANGNKRIITYVDGEETNRRRDYSGSTASTTGNSDAASTTGNSKGGNSWLDVLAGGVLLNEVNKGNLSAKDALKLQQSFLNPSGGGGLGGLGALGGGSQIATGQASDASGEACERAIRKAE